MARESAGGGNIVVVLSSYCTQRGDAALLSKWDRAETAINAGANLVLELPAFFSCQNAGIFAASSVDILEATGLVSSLSFGMEHPGFPVAPILDILVHEPPSFKEVLKEKLAGGLSYVRSRAEALSAIRPEYGEFISTPNNLLALSYMERIAKKGYDLTCMPIQRVGALHDDHELDAPFPSASAIRNACRDGRCSQAEKKLPAGTVAVLRRCMEQGAVVRSDDVLWRIARSALARAGREELALSSGMTEGMENRLRRFAFASGTWEDFLTRCATNRYTKGRIRRQVLHFLLGVSQMENLELQRSGVAYIRVLAADEAGREMLRTMRKSATLPLFGRLPPTARGPAGRVVSIERTATILWESLAENVPPGAELRRSPFMAPGPEAGGNAP